MISSIAIYRSNDVVSFTKGEFIMRGEEKTMDTVKKISVSDNRTVEIVLSNKVKIYFEGFPISYEK